MLGSTARSVTRPSALVPLLPASGPALLVVMGICGMSAPAVKAITA